MATVTKMTMGNRPSRTTAKAEDKAPQLLWLNVGYTYADEETGEETFISLPMGIPLDNMRNQRAGSKNEEFAMLAAAKNQLLSQLKEMAEGLEDGEEHILEGLQVQMRKAAPPADIPMDENPMLSKLGSISFAKQA